MSTEQQNIAREMTDLYETQMLDKAREKLVRNPNNGVTLLKTELCRNKVANCAYRLRYGGALGMMPCAMVAGSCGLR